MKRYRSGEKGEVVSINLANVLLHLSRGTEDMSTGHGRVFECKSCSRQFSSFQALGGHRASHKKPRIPDGDRDQVAKAKTHECSTCGMEFGTGQALGGHMRRHRAAAEGFGNGFVEKKSNGKRVLLDLNLPPLEEDMETRKLGLGLGLELALGLGYSK